MQSLSEQLQGYLGNSSFIRKMFEAGIELKKQFGADKVYDFSLGNPDLPAPAAVQKTMQSLADHALESFAFGYMPNAGYNETRQKMAEYLCKEYRTNVTANEVLMTCGAAGGINVFFRSILTPGDEVLVPSPYFVEYGFYVGNHGGVLKPVMTKLPEFKLDLAAFDAAITEKTRAIILNSPNNPTGQIYTASELQGLAEVVKAKMQKFGRAIFIVSDEPYRFLNFDHVEIPTVFDYFDYSVIIGSFSKNLSLAGERIGYIAVNPAIADKAQLMAGLIMANRILGFVNAPAVAQRIVADCVNEQVDLQVYANRRLAMAKALDGAGIEYMLPRGAFYFFPKSPVADERIFVDALLSEQVLAVPGRGFGCPGFIRMAFCVDQKIIENSAPAIKRAVAKLQK